jgi:UDP:flavonoid glycosyltransferase YjiC (YdhE family)
MTSMPTDTAALGEHSLDPELDRWLRAGDPPLFVGFGSMPVLGADLVAILGRTASSLGTRLLLHPAWSDIDVPPNSESLFSIRNPVDLALVFPRCCAAIHHGGAGTTGTSLAAGTPTLICSVAADQALWGTQVVRQGVGAHLAFPTMTEAEVLACVSHLMTDAVRERTITLARNMADEPPAVPRTVDLIEQLRRS